MGWVCGFFGGFKNRGTEADGVGIGDWESEIGWCRRVSLMELVGFWIGEVVVVVVVVDGMLAFDTIRWVGGFLLVGFFRDRSDVNAKGERRGRSGIR